MDLKSTLLDPKETVPLYGTTPPRHGTPGAQVDARGEKLGARVATLPADGLVVYDIQDEAGRTSEPRPFPFTGTIDPRAYSRRLAKRLGIPAITYKSLGEMTEPAWRAWLAEAGGELAIEFLSILRRPTSGT